MACSISPARPLKVEKCGCCRAKSASSDAKNCCQATQSQSGSSTRLEISTGCCCNPIIEAPAPIVTAAKVDLAAKSLLAATIEPERWFESSESFRSALSSNQLSTPPPIDVVIVFQHLTI